MVFDVLDGRKLAHGREFTSMEMTINWVKSAGLADGMRRETDGNLWSSAGWVGDGYLGVHIFSPELLPGRPTDRTDQTSRDLQQNCVSGARSETGHLRQTANRCTRCVLMGRGRTSARSPGSAGALKRAATRQMAGWPANFSVDTAVKGCWPVQEHFSAQFNRTKRDRSHLQPSRATVGVPLATFGATATRGQQPPKPRISPS